MPQWVAREYLARRGSAKFRPDQIENARCSLLGDIPQQLHVEGRSVPTRLLHVDAQPEVGQEAYDAGAEQLHSLFTSCLNEFRQPDLAPLGRQIIECCLDQGTVQEYRSLIHAE
jgi:hypothetical protein